MKIFPLIAFAISSLVSFQVHADNASSATMTAPSGTATTSANATATPTASQNQLSDQELQQSLNDSNAWLQLVDQGKYSDSWKNASVTLKLIMTETEWDKYLEKMRKPLGAVSSRELLQQRTAINPPGVPQGEYVVLFYKTAFANRPQANEQVIVVKESDGRWRPMSYFFR